MPIVLKSTINKPVSVSGVAPVHTKQVSFLKTGASAKKIIAEEETKAEIAREQGSKPFRFYIPIKALKKDFRITFLDGEIGEDGELVMNIWHEHTLDIGGRTRQLVCLKSDNEYCPICAASNDHPSEMVAALTIIDHTPYTYTKGPKMGETIEKSRKLYICKRNTIGMLGKFAQIHKGLRGLSFDVSRTGDRMARVGDMMIAVEKFDDAELQAMMGKDKEGKRLDLPYDYVDAMPFFTAEQMIEAGLGSASQIVGAEPKQDLTGHL